MPITVGTTQNADPWDEEDAFVSDLTAAMQAAVESIDEQRTRRASSGSSRTHGDPRVAVRQDTHLPPVTGRRKPSTFGGAVRQTFGPAAAATWTAIRELFALAVTFWVAAIVVTFAAPEQATLAVVITATGALRVLFLAATWGSQVTSEARAR